MLVKDIIKENKTIMRSDNYVEKPEVSIIFPISNKSDLKKTKGSIESILKQSFSNFELLLIDDATSDENCDIYRSFLDFDNRITIIRHRNEVSLFAISVYEAYSLSKGALVAFELIGSEWEEDALKLTVEYFKDNNVKAGYGIVKRYNVSTKCSYELGGNQSIVDNSLLCKNCLAKSGIIIHRDVLEDVGLFDPHISMYHVCDWDLWRRIINKYELISTGINFSTELYIENDKQVFMNYSQDWFSAEYFQLQAYDNRLTSSYFENIDVLEIPTAGVSQYFADKMLETFSLLKDLTWLENSSLAVDTTNLKDKKRILVICFGAVTASAMSFTEYNGDDFVFCYTLADSIDISMLFLADAVIQMRGLPDDNWYAHLCNALSIPIYYYVDDNFREIFKGRIDIPEYINCNKDYLSIYEGVIVSSRKLQTYYIDNYIHENVIYLPPILTNKICSKNKSHKHINIGFMGGAFREEVFVHSVLPGIHELATRYDLMLVLPDDDILRKSLKNNKTIKVEWYQRTSNYCQIINKLNGIGIDVLIHTGVDAPNNEFKTKNCLGNAVLLDAMLITSKIKPYIFVDEFTNSYLTSDNTASSWHDAIDMVLVDNDFVVSTKKRAKETCELLYSTKYGWRDLKNELFSKIQKNNMVLRSELLLDYQKRLLDVSGKVPMDSTYTNIFTVRDIDPQELLFHPIKGIKRYRFNPNRFLFSTLILAFARDVECEGSISLAVYNLDKRLLADKTIDINEAVRDGLTYVRLGQAVRGDGRDLILEVNVVNNGSGQCGLFEIKKRRSFCYRLLNHFRINSVGEDVLWIDTV